MDESPVKFSFPEKAKMLTKPEMGFSWYIAKFFLKSHKTEKDDKLSWETSGSSGKKMINENLPKV